MLFSDNPENWILNYWDKNKYSYPIKKVTDEEIFWEGTGNYLFSQDAAKI